MQVYSAEVFTSIGEFRNLTKAHTAIIDCIDSQKLKSDLVLIYCRYTDSSETIRLRFSINSIRSLDRFLDTLGVISPRAITVKMALDTTYCMMYNQKPEEG